MADAAAATAGRAINMIHMVVHLALVAAIVVHGIDRCRGGGVGGRRVARVVKHHVLRQLVE